jgi:hypothetical protein
MASDHILIMLQSSGQQAIIAVKIENVVAAAEAEPQLAAGSLAEVAALPVAPCRQPGMTGDQRLDDLPGSIAGAIVHDHHLEIVMGLPKGTGDRFGDVGGFVEAGDDDREERPSRLLQAC